MKRLSWAFGVFIAVTTAQAQTPQPSGEFKPLLNKLLRAQCHMDMCTWMLLSQVSLVGKSAKGELYAVAGKTWSSMHRGGNYDRPAPRTSETVTLNFVLCSKTKPASIDYFASGDDKGPKSWMVTELKPGRDDAVFGYNTSAYVQYMAVCHANANPDIATDAKLGQRLGYRFANGDLADQAPLVSPFDVLTRP